MRTLLASVPEGVSSGAACGATDSAGEIDKAADSCAIADGVGDKDSWAKTAEAKKVSRIAVFVFVVMSNGVETLLFR